jgi:putative addiction module component (TIGR02574 family)
MPSTSLPELLRLPKKRRMEIAARLWASVEEEADTPVPAAHRAILDKRLADYRSGKSKPISVAELMRRVRAS